MGDLGILESGFTLRGGCCMVSFFLKNLEESTGSIAYMCVYVDTKIYVLYIHTFLCVYMPIFIYIYTHTYTLTIYFTKGHIATKYTLLYFTKVISLVSPSVKESKLAEFFRTDSVFSFL